LIVFQLLVTILLDSKARVLASDTLTALVRACLICGADLRDSFEDKSGERKGRFNVASRGRRSSLIPVLFVEVPGSRCDCWSSRSRAIVTRQGCRYQSNEKSSGRQGELIYPSGSSHATLSSASNHCRNRGAAARISRVSDQAQSHCKQQ
jgi:hypothetical protein